MNKLTIFWGDKNTDSFHWQMDQSDALEQSSTPLHNLENHDILKADLNVLADMAQSKKVELVLSSNDIHVNQVSLPNKAQRHLRKAVPFLLEEQIAEPVDNMFIAIGERLPNGKIPIRGINYQYLQQLLEEFKSAEISLNSISVDIDKLSTPAEGYQLALVSDDVLIKQDDGLSWSSNKSDFSWLIQKQLAEQADDDLPVAIPMQVISDNNSNYKEFENQLPAGRFSPQAKLVDSIENYLSKSKQPNINLLQGQFEVKEENSPLKQMLFKVATIAAIVFFAHLFYQGSQWFTLQQQKEQLGQQRTALWKQAFPSRKVPANPDKALRSFMRTIGGSGESSFLSMLESTSLTIKDLQDLYPTNISYDATRNELRMDLIAKDLPTLNQYRDALEQNGHEVDMSSATQRGEGYSTRLIIRK